MATPTGLIDLIATTAPEASAQGETVVLTAPVVFPGRPELPGQIRLTLTFEHAELLMARLGPAARIARQRSQQR
jgi:hypothetical protein